MESPRLDDRSFADLMREAEEIVKRTCPSWTDRTPGDPGIVLLELFAHLTEVLIYRLNRLPEKALIEFLGLMGTRLHAPEAARVTLRLFRKPDGGKPDNAREFVLPALTRVTVGSAPGGGAEPPVFSTVHRAVLGKGEESATVLAFHAERVEREVQARAGTGRGGQWTRVARPPIVAPTGEPDDLVVEVEAGPGENVPDDQRLEEDGVVWRRWREVGDFTDLGNDRHAFVADRAGGRITFAPALRAELAGGRLADASQTIAEVPGKDRRIRVSYWRGGGPEGNVVARILTATRTPLPPGVAIVNDAPATGGQAIESVQNALVRGPHELHSLRRAVTARDYELLALQHGAIARSKALARASLWAHAPHGEVEVLLVPDIPESERPGGRASLAELRQRETASTRERIAGALAEQIPLGTSCSVSWVRYKVIRARAKLILQRDAVAADVQAKALRRLHEAISPLPSASNPGGWGFGRPLRDSHLIGLLLDVPGVLDVHPVELLLEDAPDADVASIVADARQPRTFHAAAGDALFRTVNDGSGWELSRRFEGASLRHARVHPARAGLLAVASQPSGPDGSAAVHVSLDCGETWLDEHRKDIAARIDDMAWDDAPDGVPMLWLATDAGLFRVELRPGEMRTVQVAVDRGHQDLGFRAVAAFRAHGRRYVVAAAHEGEGVYGSDSSGEEGSFRFLGARGKLIRTLALQVVGPRVFVWAGTDALQATDPGEGCLRREVLAGDSAGADWEPYARGWQAGTCYGIAFAGAQVLAASFAGGILRLDGAVPEPRWRASELTCGLPIHEVRRSLDRIDALAVGKDGGFVLAGGPHGIHRAELAGDGELAFVESSRRVFRRDPVTLPPTWLFASGEHELDVDGSGP